MRLYIQGGQGTAVPTVTASPCSETEVETAVATDLARAIFVEDLTGTTGLVGLLNSAQAATVAEVTLVVADFLESQQHLAAGAGAKAFD